MSPPVASSPWQAGDAYERYMGRWSRHLAPLFVQSLAEAPGRRWLDVGCGTGALCAAILAHAAPAALTGVDPSAGFLATARAQLPAQVALHTASADRIPMPDGAVDTAVSGLVLNFVPDAVAALREMARVTVPGGCVAVYVWDYAGRMELTHSYWDAAEQVDASSAQFNEGRRFALCHPPALAAAFTTAGLVQVEGSTTEIAMRFADFEDYWRPFLGGQGPAPAHAMSLDEDKRQAVREHLRGRVLEGRADGPFTLAARAWVARALVPG